MERVCGPRLLLWGLAIAFLFLSTAHAVYDPENTVKKGKRWAISAGLRTGYDDNPMTQTTNPQGSWFGGFTGMGRYSYPTDTSFFTASTSMYGNLFADRPGNMFDFSDSIDMTFAHTFSPRLSLDVSDHFRYGRDPQLADNNTVYRYEGDYVNNGLNVGLSYQLSTKWFLDFSVSDDMWYYSDSQTRQDLARQAITVGPTLRYRLTEKTTLSGGYTFSDIAYDTSPRDAQSQNLTAGISQAITPKWSASLNAGVSLRTEDNPTSKTSHTEPFFDFGTSYAISEKATLSAGARNSFQETDVQSYYFSTTTSGYMAFNWSFARDLSSSTTMNIVSSELSNAMAQAQDTGSYNDMTYVVSQTFSWKLRENLSLDLVYSWTRLDSDLPNRAYRRNVVSVGANVLF